MEVKDFLSITHVIVFILSGLFLLFIDRPYLKKKGYTKDEKICRVVGFFYVFGIPAIYLLISMFFK